MSKPSLPQGTRDFGPQTVRKRTFILETIRRVFEVFGFEPLETPAMENLETLMGKYGEEGDKLIFKILNNGISDPKNTEKARAGFEQVLLGKNSKDLTERALRYDLTIPLARYVAMNHAQMVFPFKRYQMQPVWRADRPQKGRYREFWQCDADVVGIPSLWAERELLTIYGWSFQRLRIPVSIQINHRQVLAGLAQKLGDEKWLIPMTVAIDKLDKIGLPAVLNELSLSGMDESGKKMVEDYLKIEGKASQRLEALGSLLGSTPAGKKGLEEISQLLQGLDVEVEWNQSLARGLNYYTGTIVEVKAATVEMGSIGGGGRYDDLTGLFGLPQMPGAGISFGVDRIYDVMESLQLFPGDAHAGSRVLFFNLGEQESSRAFSLLLQLRQQGIAAELFHESAKFEKQFRYAEKKHIPYVAILGSEEIRSNTIVLKNLRQGSQQSLTTDDFLLHRFL